MSHGNNSELPLETIFAIRENILEVKSCLLHLPIQGEWARVALMTKVSEKDSDLAIVNEALRQRGIKT